MIRLFRKTRLDSVTLKKAGAYLLYAFGEMLLVVVGIIIAININNNNEARKNRLKMDSILLEIQKELTLDILKAEELSEYYQRKDSLIQLVLTDKLDSTFYNQGSFYLIYNYNVLEMHDDGYENLIRDIENIPESHLELFKQLKTIYVDDAWFVNLHEERMSTFVNDRLENLSNTKPWFHTMISGKINDTIVDYFLHNPFYKNDVTMFAIYSSNMQFGKFNSHAISAYVEMTRMTNSTAGLADFVQSQNKNLSLIEQFAGDYLDPSVGVGSETEVALNITTSDENSIQVTQGPNDKAQSFHPLSKNTFVSLDDGSYLVFHDKVESAEPLITLWMNDEMTTYMGSSDFEN